MKEASGDSCTDALEPWGANTQGSLCASPRPDRFSAGHSRIIVLHQGHKDARQGPSASLSAHFLCVRTTRGHARPW